MRKLIKIFLSILIIVFLLILYVVYRDYKTNSILEKKIMTKTDVEKIVNLNVYGDNYIVMDDDNLYIFDKKYVELLKVDRILIHKNNEKYDIIFDKQPMYMKDYYKGNKLYYVYYDLYTYEKIDEIVVGG